VRWRAGPPKVTNRNDPQLARDVQQRHVEADRAVRKARRSFRGSVDLMTRVSNWGGGSRNRRGVKEGKGHWMKATREQINFNLKKRGLVNRSKKKDEMKERGKGHAGRFDSSRPKVAGRPGQAEGIQERRRTHHDKDLWGGERDNAPTHQ